MYRLRAIHRLKLILAARYKGLADFDTDISHCVYYVNVGAFRVFFSVRRESFSVKKNDFYYTGFPNGNIMVLPAKTPGGYLDATGTYTEYNGGDSIKDS